MWKKIALILSGIVVAGMVFINFFVLGENEEQTKIAEEQVVIQTTPSSKETSAKKNGNETVEIKKEEENTAGLLETDEQTMERFLTTFFTYTNEETTKERLEAVKEELTDSLYKELSTEYLANAEKDQAVFSEGGFFSSFIRDLKIYEGQGQFVASFTHYLKTNDLEADSKKMFVILVLNSDGKISTFTPTVVLE